MLKEKVTSGYDVILERRDGQLVRTSFYVVALDAFEAEKVMQRWFLSKENEKSTEFKSVVSVKPISSRNIIVDLDTIPIKQSVKWKGLEKNGETVFVCPMCNHETKENNLTSYCPDCGQKMEGRTYPGIEPELGPDSTV